MSQVIDSLVGKGVIDEINQLSEALRSARESFEPLLKDIKSVSSSFSTSSKDIKSMVEVMINYNSVVDKSSIALTNYNRIQQKLGGAYQKLSQQNKSAQADVLAFTNATKAQAKEVEVLLTQEARTNAERGKSTRRLQEARLEQQKATQELKRDIALSKQSENVYAAKAALLARLRDRYRETGGTQQRLVPFIQKLDRELKNMDATMGIHTRHVGNYVRGLTALIPGLSRFTTGFGLLGIAIMGVVSAFKSFTDSVKYGLSINREFEQATANLASILGVTRKETAALQRQAIELGRTTEWTTTQVTNAQLALTKLGFSQNSIMNMTKPLLGFATALGADLESAAKVAGQALRAFNISSMDTEKMLSLMTVAANRSAMDFAFLERAIAIVGASASVAGVPLKDTLSLLGVLSNSGLDASRAATALRNIFLYLVDDSKKLGKELKGTEMNAAGISKAFKELRDRGVDLADMFQLTDKRAVNALAVLIQNSEQIMVLNKEMDNLQGSLDRIRQTRLDTLEGDIILMKSAWEAFWLSFRDNIPIVRNTIQWITEQLVQMGKDREERNQTTYGNSAFGAGDINEQEIRRRVFLVDREARQLYDIYLRTLDDSSKVGQEAQQIAYENFTGFLKKQVDEAQKSYSEQSNNQYKILQRLQNEFGQQGKETAKLYAQQIGITSQITEEINKQISANARLEELDRLKILDNEKLRGQNLDANKVLSLIFEQENNIEASKKRQLELEKQREPIVKRISVLVNRRAVPGAPTQIPGNYLPVRQEDGTFSSPAADTAKRLRTQQQMNDLLREEQGLTLTQEQILQGMLGIYTEMSRTMGQVSEASYSTMTPKQLLANQRALKQEAKQLSDEEKARIQIQLRAWEEEAVRQKAIAEDSRIFYADRNVAAEKWLILQKEILNKQKEISDFETRRNAETKNSALVTPEQVNKATENQRLDTQLKTNTEIAKREVEHGKLMAKISRDNTELQLNEFVRGIKQRMAESDKLRKEELAGLGTLNNAGLDSDTYEQNVASINLRYAERLKDQINIFYGEWLQKAAGISSELAQLLSAEFSKFARQLMQTSANAGVVFSETTGQAPNSGGSINQRGFFGKLADTVSGTKRNTDGTVNIEATKARIGKTPSRRLGSEMTEFLNSESVQLTADLFEQMTDVANSYYDNELSRIDELWKRREEYYERQFELLDKDSEYIQNNYDNKLLSEENYRNQQAQIELQREALETKRAEEEKKMEAERVKMQRKQAQWAKASALSQAIMSTALGFANALWQIPAPANIPFSAMVAALGAAQVAMIAAQPIPKYAKGTEDHKGGYMITGDAGVHEYGITPQGEVFKTPNTPTLMTAPMHTQIFPNETMFTAYLREIGGIGLDDVKQHVTVKNELSIDNTSQNKLLGSINRGVHSLKANEVYRLRMEKNRLQFKNW